MDFELTEEQNKFKQEVCEFLDREVTEGVIKESYSGMGYGPHSWELMRKLGAKGWLAPSFPKQYGGLGLSRIYRLIVAEELDYRRALKVVVGGPGIVGVDMAGPIIMRYGGEELKKEFLPRIARGEIELALGYTEPEAGSDLSRIEMHAEEDGDYYTINGQKLFNTHCHFAQYHWLLVRTDFNVPPHKGMSIFIVDLKMPGIDIQPLWEMSNTRTNQVFYKDVRVSKKYLVGEKNQGWYYLVSALDLERMTTVGEIRKIFEELVAYTKDVSLMGVPLCKNPLIRQKLAEMAVEINVAHKLMQRTAWLQDKGKIPIYESALLKLFISELYQRLMNEGLKSAGLHGQAYGNSKWAAFYGKLEHYYRGSFVLTIGAGTSEIMRNIIAIRGLHLPRQ
jgi:alkylation response protein AidB-like acyl-CoA dehydrogenase